MGLCSNHSPRTLFILSFAFSLNCHYSSQTSCWYCKCQHKNSNICIISCFWWIGYRSRIRTMGTRSADSLVFWCFRSVFFRSFLICQIQSIFNHRSTVIDIFKLNLMLGFIKLIAIQCFCFFQDICDCFFILPILKSRNRIILWFCMASTVCYQSFQNFTFTEILHLSLASWYLYLFYLRSPCPLPVHLPFWLPEHLRCP